MQFVHLSGDLAVKVQEELFFFFFYVSKNLRRSVII